MGPMAASDDPDGRPARWLGRALLHFVAGLAVGFLFLAEFALRTVPIVLGALLLLAVLGLMGGLRDRPSLSVWSIFVFGALLFPLLIDAGSAFLPLCNDALASGVACIARDYRGQFAVELGGFLASCLGALLYVRLGLRRRKF